MQFSLKRLFFLTALVAVMFGWVGRFWPLGTAIAVVVSLAAGAVLLAFGSVKSWKLVVWTCAVFLGSLVGIRYALALPRYWQSLHDWPNRNVEAVALAVGALFFGLAVAVALTWLPRKPRPDAEDG